MIEPQKGNSHARKIVLIFPFNLLSHYLRCLVLADQYDPKCYRIYFQSSPAYNQYVQQHNYETFEAKHFDTDMVMQSAREFRFNWLNQPILEEVLASQIEAIEELKPDLVIGDVAPTLKMAAEITGVTYHTILNGYLTKYYRFTRSLSQTHPLHPTLKLLPPFIRNALIEVGERVVFKYVHRPFKRLRKQMNLKYVSDYLEEITGDLNQICDLSTLFPQHDLPNNYKFIGPLIYNNLPTENWVEQLPSEKPLICVTMGSSGDWSKLAFLNDPYYAKYNFLIAGYTGHLFSAPHLQTFSFVNLPQLMPKISLMICHGGNGTIYLGIISKVYLLCITSHFEQEWNVQALQRCELGKSANGFNTKQWRSEIEQAIERSTVWKTLK